MGNRGNDGALTRSAYGALDGPRELRGTFPPVPTTSTGHVLGIIVVDLAYPKLPGNVANAWTFDYPVLYAEVRFEIEQLFAGDPSIKDMVVDAARDLGRRGVRAIIGACGYFAHFQREVAEVVQVPVFMSSLCQLPLIKLGLRPTGKVLVLAADGASLNDALLAKVGADLDRVVVQNVGDLDSFQAIRHSIRDLENGRLTDDLAALASRRCEEDPDIEAVLLECSDLPPYAAAIQKACGRPVYDFITLANWAAAAVTQRPYYGWF